MMALSNSLQSGQIPMLCQMCEESNEIKWKCIQCNFLLCTKCQKLHKKVKSDNQHTIIDIMDIATHQEEVNDQPDINNIPCSVHNGQNCCLFCQTCEEVICPLCILSTHAKHKMTKLDEGYKLTLKAIKNFHSEVEETILQTEKVLSRLNVKESSEISKYETERQKILKRERVLKKEVEKHTKNLLTELDQRRDPLMTSVQDEKNKSEKMKKDLENRRESLSYSISRNNASEVFNIFKQERVIRADRKQKVEPVNTKLKGLPQYVPGQQPILIAQHGELTELKVDDDQTTLNFKWYSNLKLN
ncbi:E3 ubiquitin-protein ligase TRIM45-like [Mytilus trossulus]|uniref:E3 ubiquitin-protein ligase TRIM45-like n=1 Tax=Mytilus trossulus TaxID=6551 RepID=UPI00300405F9